MLGSETQRLWCQLRVAEGEKGREVKGVSGHVNCDRPWDLLNWGSGRVKRVGVGE